MSKPNRQRDPSHGQSASEPAAPSSEPLDEAATVAVLQEDWVPDLLRNQEPEIIEAVMRATRRVVSKAKPTTLNDFGRMTRAVAAFLLWKLQKRGPGNVETLLEVETLFEPDIIEFFCTTVNKGIKRDAWQKDTRRSLNDVGRVVNRQRYAVKPKPLASSEPAAPYPGDVAAAFGMAAASMLMRGRPQEVWAFVGSVAFGASAVELREAYPHDLIWLTEGRLALRVRGRNQRLVPIRSSYQELALKAARLAGDERFIPDRSRNAVHTTASRIAVNGLGSWSYRRGRSTWLTAHLIAGTPLALIVHEFRR